MTSEEQARKYIDKIWQAVSEVVHVSVKDGEKWEEVKDRQVLVSLDWLNDISSHAGTALTNLDPENKDKPMWAETAYMSVAAGIILNKMIKNPKGARRKDLPLADKDKLLGKK